MATLTLTFPKGDPTGALLRKLSQRIEEMSLNVPDAVPTGADTTVVIDSAPATGRVSVQITGGPYTSSLYIV